MHDDAAQNGSAFPDASPGDGHPHAGVPASRSRSASETVWPANSFLGLLNRQERAGFLEIGRSRRFAARQALLNHGDDSRFVFAILSGFVRAAVVTESGRERVLSFRGPGELLGEMAFFSGEPRSATVTALVPVECLQVSATELGRFLEQHPRVAQTAAGILSTRLRAANARRGEFLDLGASGRVAQVIADIADQLGIVSAEGRVLGPAYTQADLASLASVSPKTMEKILKGLEDAGLILRNRRMLVVRDLATLRAHARTSRSGGDPA